MTARPLTGTSSRPDLPLAVVVGAGGMATAAARRLGQRYRLLVTDIDEAKLAAVVASFKQDGFDIQSFVCDLTKTASVAALAKAAEAQGPLRVLAHVTGLSPSMGDWRAIMTVNLLGAHHVADAMLPLSGQGTAAIFVSSLAAHLAPPAADVVALLDNPMTPDFLDRLEQAEGGVITTQRSYQLSKYALNRLCRQRAADWGTRGARIVSLSPGLIATPMGALEFERQPMKYDLLAKTPIQREGTMLEIADAIEFLASEQASFISGTDLRVDGGIAAALEFAS